MKKDTILLVSLVLSSVICPSPITLYNNTDRSLWVSLYSQKESSYYQLQAPQQIAKNSSLVVSHLSPPEHNPYYLVLHYDTSLLIPIMDSTQWGQSIHKNCNHFYEKKFYIERIKGILKIYNVFEWKLVAPLIAAFNYVSDSIAHAVHNSVDNHVSAVKDNPYAQHDALVREGNELHPGERLYIQNRKKKTQKALEAIVQSPIIDTALPTISYAFSGGGLRASLATLGSLSGLEKSGLLDAALFGAFVSGSTWSYAGWCARGGTLDDYKKELFAALSKSIVPKTAKDIELMVDALLVKVVEGQPVTLVDIFGLLLGNHIFGGSQTDPYRSYLSQSIDRVWHGEWMMPIYTAIGAQEESLASLWYECTPYEFGSAWLEKYIPVWAFGRKFVDGQSIDYAPEQSISYMLGLFGSAFAAQVEQLYEEFKTDLHTTTLNAFIEKLLKPIDNQRCTYAQVHNFSAGMYKEPITQLELLRMADAGTTPGFNFPYPPLSQERAERYSDIIIFFNMAIDNFPGESLLAAQQYARDHNFKFPHITTATLNEHTMTVFKDENDPTVPIIIYMPLINDPTLWPLLDLPEYSAYKPLLYGFDLEQCIMTGPCTIFEFQYNEELSQRLAAVAEFNVCVNKERICDEIKALVALKQ